MSLNVLGQPLRPATAGRIAVVLAGVLALHVYGLYEVAAGLDTLKPESATQTTLAVSLIAPPAPPPPAAAAPAAEVVRPPRRRSETAPTLPAASVTAPAEPARPEPEPEPAPPPAEAPPPPSPPPVEAPPPPPPPTPVEEPRLPPGISEVPTTGRIAYRTRYTRLRGITALTFIDWNVDPVRRRYDLWLRIVDPSGLLDLRSSGSLQAFGIAPERYVERIEIANRELRAEFDWNTRIVAFTGRGAGQPAGFLDGTQDPLSLQFHLPLLAQANPSRFVPGAEIAFSIARRGVEPYVFRVEGYEAVRIGDTELKALKVDRRRGPEASRRVEIWMSPEHQWLPVRLRFTDSNDEVWDSVLAVQPGAELPSEPSKEEPIKP